MILDALTRAHKAIAATAGHMSLVIERRSVSPSRIRLWVKNLRRVADDLEREINT